MRAHALRKNAYLMPFSSADGHVAPPTAIHGRYVFQTCLDFKRQKKELLQRGAFGFSYDEIPFFAPVDL